MLARADAPFGLIVRPAERLVDHQPATCSAQINQTYLTGPRLTGERSISPNVFPSVFSVQLCGRCGQSRVNADTLVLRGVVYQCAPPSSADLRRSDVSGVSGPGR